MLKGYPISISTDTVSVQCTVVASALILFKCCFPRVASVPILFRCCVPGVASALILFGVQLVGFFRFGISMVLFDTKGISRCPNTKFMTSPYLLFIIRTIHDSFLPCDDSLMGKEEYVGNPSETDPTKSQVSSKASNGNKNSTKRRHQRHHQRQPGE